MPNERKLSPTAIPVEELARILAALGGHITIEMIRADIAAGAPTNPDGTINLIQYGAWLARAVADGD